MATKKNIDASGLLYFGKEYFKKLQTKFVAIETGKTLTTNDYTTGEKEKLGGIESGAEVNIIEAVKVNGTALTPNSNKEVNIAIAEGSTAGTVSVAGADIAVHGLGSAAYAATTDFDASGAAAAVLGASTDTSSAVTVYGVKAALDEAMGNGGSVSSQISAAIADLDSTKSGSASGTAANGGVFVASGVEVVEVDGAISAVNITSTEVDPAGAAATAQAAAEGYADDLISDLANNDVAVAGQFVTAAVQEDGVVTVSRAAVTSENVTFSSSVEAFDGISTVKGALEKLSTDIDAGGSGSVVSLSEADGSGDVLKVYTLMQGSTTVGTINIPKDFLVKSGSIVDVSGVKTLRLVLNAKSGTTADSNVDIPVSDLVDAYTAGNGIAISAQNEVSAVVDATSESYLTVGASGLKLAGVGTAISNAQSAAESYADGLIAGLDGSVSASGTPASSGTMVLSGVTEVDGVITSCTSVEVEAAGAAAAAQAAAESYADTAAAGALQDAKDYADSVAGAVTVTASVATGSANYMTSSASGTGVTYGLSAGAIASLAAADSAVQTISKTDGTYVTLTATKTNNDVAIVVGDSAIGTALGGKADKVSNAVAGNLASLDANGNLSDSGVAAADLTITYMTNQEIQDVVDSIFASGSGE